MEGGNKTPIDLEAGLNISTSDMLTPLARQSFQHNWQKYQGKFLPNSLRFEKNGWAAGWNVYNFEYNTYRSEQNGYYVSIGQYNNYVKALNIYDSESSYNAIHTTYVVTDSVVVVGDLTVNGNIISGKIKDKDFQLTWDPVAHTLSCVDPTIEITQTINNDYSVAFTITDLSSSFSYDFDILLSKQLTGDAITGVSYDGFDGTAHNWGQYSYNTQTGILTTPEGEYVTPTVSGNEITFDYTQSIIDETINITYTLSKFYPRFSNITYQDQTNKDKLLIATESGQLAFNRYTAGVTPKKLNARDKYGVVIDWQLPLWLTVSLGVDRTQPEAKKCDNTNNYEIATMQGTGLNMGGTYNNIWDGDGTFSIDDNYRPHFTKYLKNITHRFNQIFLNNTIALSSSWDYKKHLLNEQVWFADSRRYANIRNKRSADMTKLLGDVYTWGTFSADPRTVFEYNNPYYISDKNSCVYTKSDISQIISFKLAGEVDNNNEGDDQDFIDNNLTIDNSLIATFSGTVDEYQSTQDSEEYTDLYTDGIYTGTTYETIEVSEEPFWPFEKVPKFNFIKTPESYDAIVPTGSEDPSAEGWYEFDGSNYVLSTDTSIPVDKTYYKRTPASYDSVTPTGTEDPSVEGWYELDGSNYVLSVDTTVTTGKTYYKYTPESYDAIVPTGSEDPSAEGWYEFDGSNYVLSTDTSIPVDKTYYKRTPAEVVNGVYWTDGTNIIDDLDTFKAKVLGTYDSTVDVMNTVIKENPAYNRQRIVSQYAAGYDFDYLKKSSYSTQQDYTKDVNAWNEIWKKYYPNTPSPQDTFDEEATSNDDTYLDFTDIIINKNVDPQIRYVTPGVYLSGKYAVPYNCKSGLIVFNDDSEYKLSANIWHHATQVNNKYVVNNVHEAGVIKFSGVSVNIPFYFGSATSDNLVSGSYSASFIQVSEKASLESAKLTIGVNYDCKKVEHSNYITWEWSKVPAQDSNWLGNLHAYYSAGKVTIEDASLNTGVEQVQQYYFTSDINSGIKFAWPVWGHSQTRLVYPEMKDFTHINDSDAFVLTPIPTAELINNKDSIYFDRNDTDKSILLFKVVENSRQPDNSNGTGSFMLKLEPVNNGFMYYAKKIYNENREEVVADYYIPGVAWGSPDNGSGNLIMTGQYPILELDWTPVIRRFPISANEVFSNKNTNYLQHKFYTNDKSLISNVNGTLKEINFNNLTRDIVLNFPNGNYVLHYDSANETTTGDVNQLILHNDVEDVSIVTCAGTAENVVMPVLIELDYKNNKAKFVQISNYTLLSSDGNKCVITDGTSQIVYLINQQSVTSPKTGVDVSVVTVNDGQHVKVESKVSTQYTAYLKAVYNGIFNGSKVSFEWQGMTFNWDFGLNIDTGISVLSTDIRKPDKTKVIGKLKPEGQYQLLKQQWNTTVEVENYWWIDATHVLELNQSSFVLKRNTKELDDWNGERFEKVFEVGRDKILPTNITRYFTTNVYKSNRPALFVTAQEDLGCILLTFYNPRRVFEVVGTQRIRIRQREIGQVLNDVTTNGNTALFNTYNPITAGQMLSKADWSHTIVGDWMIIGCHLGNNFDQWAFVINLNNFTLTKCIQGYGYVGLHGDLTGGQIPNDYFDTDRGFNDTVQPLSVLMSDDQDANNLDAAYEVGSVDKINNIDAKVVGTSEQQWYIKNRLYGIVSHLTFSNGNFTKQLIPVTNNFAAIYNSPSFASSVFADSFVQLSPFASMFIFEAFANFVWQSFMGLIGYPLIYSVAPRYAQLVYLQQTFGQYAYVHYNSSKSLPEKEITNSITGSGISEVNNKQTDPVLSSTFTFDKQKFTQYARTSLNYYSTILAILVSAFADSLQFLDKKVSINEEVNTSTIKDSGRKFVDNAVANTGDMLASAVMTQSKNDSGITSVVTGIKSLDMFYSTSDQQRVFAGPGFVEHQMVANCVAQSVTDTQVEGKVQQFYFCIRSLTTLQIKTTIAVEKATAEWLSRQAECVGQQMVCGNSLGAIGAAMKAAAMAIELMVKAKEIALVELEKILDAICAKGITVNTDGQVSRHALSVEGKHKYGEKNETFMWPCFGVQSGQVKYTDEWVECGTRNTPWSLTLNSAKYYTNGLMNMCNIIMTWYKPAYSQNKMGVQSEAVAYCGDTLPWNAAHGMSDFDKPGDTYRAYYMNGNVPFYQASAFGKAEERNLPDDMACIEGVCRFLPNEPFKNENIAVSDPAFAPSMIHDFIIDKSWDLAQCATQGLAQWVTVKDTKITNCPPSNIIVSDTFCGVACPYSAIEVKRGIEKAYMRPWAITPNTLALNCTGYNTIFQDKLYHAFDGISFRMVNLVGSPGMNKNRQSFLYSFQINDRFKRSNICPANELQGNFESEPVQAVDSIDKLYTVMTVASKEKGLEAGTIGEDKDAVRWAVPVFTEPVSTLPACVKTMTAATLAVVEGVTSLVTAQVTDTNAAYKAPLSVDFTIGKNVYRATEEYICSVQPAEAGNVITELIPSLGLKFIGSTPTEAFFYSKATRCYYTFSGSSLTKVDMMERFRDIQKGYWDFVNQEVVMPCLMTFKRLNEEVEDKDTETDNIIIPVLSKGEVSGELPPPLTTIFNDRSWYKCVSLPCGFAYQGPNRVIINRAVFCEYMERSVKDNYNKWKKMSRDKYVTHREYPEVYDNIMQDVHGIDGWTYNPFVLVTSALGQSEDTDCMFEWNITFCWPIEMDLLYGVDNYACVNICAETMTPGGKRKSEVTHVFLTKELFTRNGSYGYYSFRFQSKNGMGNRERLHIWSDQYIAISSIDCESKTVTQRRTEQLTQQIDVQKLKEL